MRARFSSRLRMSQTGTRVRSSEGLGLCATSRYPVVGVPALSVPLALLVLVATDHAPDDAGVAALLGHPATVGAVLEAGQRPLDFRLSRVVVHREKKSRPVVRRKRPRLSGSLFGL